jgi:His-Xaa-Ser system radical SAM maturase HxsC
MCSQPPKDVDDTFRVEENLEIIRLIAPPPTYLGITGGEPTLMGEGLFRHIEALRDSLPNTRIHMLTNGRRFAWPEFTQRFVEVRHPAISLGIPLYADNATDHDYVVQARGAFDQTMVGLYGLARYDQDIEIRVVLHALTVGRLRHLSEYIYRNLPFVNHIALMGLEITGYTPHNIDKLWIDPADYQAELEEATAFLHARGMNVSIYNHQLCVLRPSLWSFARKSISDWKNIYLDECATCSLRERCGGLFKSAERRRSVHIRPFLTNPNIPGQPLPLTGVTMSQTP